MTPKQFYKANHKAYVEKVALEAGTNLANFRLIALYNGSCSKDLANRLAEASRKCMTRDEILYPEDYETTAA